LGARLVLLAKALAVDPSSDEDRNHGDCIAKPDHARPNFFMKYPPKNRT